MLAVIDTNVLLSALLRGRGARPILEALIARRFRLLISETLLEELASVLSRPEWLKLIGADDCRDFLTTIREAATMVRSKGRVTVCRDPEDNAVLECALAGQADFIVTGDKDLLVLNPFRGIRILKPADFRRFLR